MTSLTSTRAALDAAREKLTKATADFERGRQAHQDAKDEASRYAGEKAAWIARNTRDVERWVADGCGGPRPVPAADAKAIQRELRSEAAVQATAAALATFETAERNARREFAAAGTAHREAALALLADEIDGEAAAISRDEDALELRRQQLRGARAVVPPSAVVRRAAPTPQDWVHVPLPQLAELEAQGRGGGADSLLHTPRDRQGTVEISGEAIAYWERRLEELLSGPGVIPSGTRERAA